MNKKLKGKREKPRTGEKKQKKAVVLLSGGLDSTVTLYMAKAKGFYANCLTFDYGQKHKKEINRARKIAKKSDSPWHLIQFRLPWGGSSLLDKKIAIPKKRSQDSQIPSTYVPARNLIFLSFAASFAETIKAEAIFIGANEIDFSGYPDCRSDFLKSFDLSLKKGTKTGTIGKKISIIAPLLRKNKRQIVLLAKRLRVPLEVTWSCYQGGKHPCGVCDSCRLRKQGFMDASVKDPVR